jgi:hypothetical protein
MAHCSSSLHLYRISILTSRLPATYTQSRQQAMLPNAPAFARPFSLAPIEGKSAGIGIIVSVVRYSSSDSDKYGTAVRQMRGSSEEIGTAVLLTRACVTRMISAVPGGSAESAASRDFHETSLDTPAFHGEFSGILGTSFCTTGGGALC